MRPQEPSHGATSQGAAVFLTCALAVWQVRAPRLEPASRPLHSHIDELIEAAAVGPLAPMLLRRRFPSAAYTCDLTGIIPTADEARDFLADQTADEAPAS